MTSEPSPRQVLYALVSAGFVAVVALLAGGAAVAGAVPVWWTVSVGLLVAAVTGWGAVNWRRTGRVLLASIALFALWAIGTLLLV